MLQDILSKKEARLKEKEMVVEDKAAQLERVTEQLKISEEIVSKIRKEVFELEKQNKEKMILIEDLSFKIENTNTEEDCSNCKETNQLTTNFNNLRSKYDDLLEEYSKTNKIFIDIKNYKEVIDETISCKDCTSRFTDKQRFTDHMTSEHSVKCTLCHLIFESNKLQEYEHILHCKKSLIIENTNNCKYCELICSEVDILKKHVRKEHKTKCNKFA